MEIGEVIALGKEEGYFPLSMQRWRSDKWHIENSLSMLIYQSPLKQAFNSLRLPIKEFNSWAETLGGCNNHAASGPLKLML